MTKERTMREMPKVRPLVGVVAALVFLASAVGCGLVSDQGKARQDVKQKVEAKEQQAKKKVEAKEQQAKKEAKKEVTELQKKVNAKEHELKKKVEVGKEDLKKTVQAGKEDLKKMDELLKKVDAQGQQNQKKK